MESVTIRFQDNVLKKIDKSISQNNFNSRTEFIREAVRDKLNEISKDELIKEFMMFRGKAKKKTSDAQLRSIREEVSKEMEAKFDKKFKILGYEDS